MTSGPTSPRKTLTLFGFFAITASMVMTVYEYPTFATSGLNLVFFLLLGGFCWFIPVALCAAEMATVKGWEEGGIFKWVGATLGERWGFAAIFFQWLQITVGFVTMIYFILGAVGYVLDWDSLDNDPWMKFAGVLVVFWVLTLSQLGGTKYTARIAKAGFVGGILIPGIVLFILAIAYLATGGHVDIDMSASNIVPDFSQVATLVVFVSFILAYMGVEASASHVNEMVNPRRDYPLAMFLLVIVAVLFNTIGGLSVAAVVPESELSLSAGVVQTFAGLLEHFSHGLVWLAKVLAVMIALGVAGEVSAWVVGPARGMYVTAQQGILPKSMRKVNKADVPVNFVAVQGVIVTGWAALLTFGGGSGNVSFFTAIALTTVIYLVGYLLFFIGYMVLVIKKKNLERAYQIPGGTVVKMIVAVVGFVVSGFALVISFFTPSNLAKRYDTEYTTILVCAFVVAVALPFLIYAMHDKKLHTHFVLPRRLRHDEVNKFVPPIARGEHAIVTEGEDVMDQTDNVRDQATPGGAARDGDTPDRVRRGEPVRPADPRHLGADGGTPDRP
ncbi:glutamate:gamma-aminobutyrate antiporter [Gordonia jinghuaiqii]|uniref:Glutamate/gamma-aminobutyrate antiporter n=1 Tax=Gordonia jinghuaiqii TaxID=2758710 RepID=A0A7D7M0V2_9ACTN|nr:glutamate:gamma-aminobutyrate antiporter [Gordonia jinghuaiqii]MCR5980496.1 glutamate:gamma-aminobutyrate antiporter [Gordonia jinghuaiqii]QMT03336.1 glutamate:gamma-aminobutyrate antiporter [Gordonia jinghuaiqii]